MGPVARGRWQDRNRLQCGAVLVPRREHARFCCEMARYRAYQAYLAGYTIGRTFGRTADFLNLVAAHALSIPGRERPLDVDSGVTRPSRS